MLDHELGVRNPLAVRQSLIRGGVEAGKNTDTHTNEGEGKIPVRTC